MTLQPNPAKIRAATDPILPVPQIPTVLPWRSNPTRPSSEKLPSRTRTWARWILRFSVSTSATACSATACGEYSGTRTTGMPSAAAAARSTWL